MDSFQEYHDLTRHYALGREYGGISTQTMLDELCKIPFTTNRYGGWDGCILGSWCAMEDLWRENLISDDEYTYVALNGKIIENYEEE